MRSKSVIWTGSYLCLAVLSVFCLGIGLAAPPLPAGKRENVVPSALAKPSESSAATDVSSVAVVAPMYAVDFISTAAKGIAINDAGDVVGTSYTDPGCGSFCLPPLDTVVWKSGVRIVLPPVPGLSGIYITGINTKGWVAGVAGVPGTTTHAVVWKPNGTTYQAIDLGTLPGTTISDAVGIDNLGRVVGYSKTQFFPPVGAPFVWTEATGMIDLSAQGFPNEAPLAISPGGTVALSNQWYRLGQPGSITPLAAPPRGFLSGNDATDINDAGDMARFLVTTSSQNLVYLFRYHHAGTWQQLSPTGTGHLATCGVGSINNNQDITATILGGGFIAAGPDGLAESLSPKISPAYGGAAITNSGPMNSSGQILAQILIGQSQRLVRLTPVQTLPGGRIQVRNLDLRARFIQDRQNPGLCIVDGTSNVAWAKLTVTDESGAPLSGVMVNGRFLDDYWTNAQVSGTTNSQGIVTFTYQGQCGVGAIAFFVDHATKGLLVFDKTQGKLADSEVPMAGPSTADAIDYFLASLQQGRPNLLTALEILTGWSFP